MGSKSIFKQSDEERKKLVLTDNILKTVILLSAPVVFMMLAQSFIQVFDNWFVYNFSTLNDGGAISYSNTALQIAIQGGIGLSVAGTALIGRLNGAGDSSKTTKYTQQFLFLMVVTSLIVSVFTLIVAPFYTNAALEEIREGVLKFMLWTPIVIPFQFFNTAYYAIKNASGKSEVQFVFTVIMLVLKIIFNALFVAVMKMGVMGIVMANFLSQFIISVILAYDAFIKPKGMNLHFKGFKADMVILKDFLKIGIPSVVTNVTMSIGFMLINLESMKFGRDVLNTMSIANSITNLAYSTLNSFGTSITSMVSMNVGAANFSRAKDITKCVFKLVTIMSIVVIIVMSLLSGFTSQLFTKEPHLIEMVTATQRITIFGVYGFVTASIMCGIFVALGQTKIPLFIGLCRVIIFRYLFIIICTRFLNINSYLVIPFATFFGNTTSLLAGWLLYRRIDWNNPLGQFHFKKERTIEEKHNI